MNKLLSGKVNCVSKIYGYNYEINYQLDAIEYLFTSARHVSGLHAHLQEQWVLQFLYICSIWCPWFS